MNAIQRGTKIYKRQYTPEEIRTIRDRLGMTNKEFALLIGVHYTTVGKWFNVGSAYASAEVETALIKADAQSRTATATDAPELEAAPGTEAPEPTPLAFDFTPEPQPKPKPKPKDVPEVSRWRLANPELNPTPAAVDFAGVFAELETALLEIAQLRAENARLRHRVAGMEKV